MKRCPNLKLFNKLLTGGFLQLVVLLKKHELNFSLEQQNTMQKVRANK